jgi:hypothetical protein
MKMDSETKLHSAIGASSAERWMNCPRSIYLSEHAPPKVESSYALEGTIAHQAAEQMARGKTEEELIGKFPKEMIRHAREYVEYIDLLSDSDAIRLVEHSFNLHQYDPEAFGTADCVVINGDELFVIDYKYGAGIAVEAKENPQLRFYGLGALFSLPKDKQREIKFVYMVVYQPRAHHAIMPVRKERLPKGKLLKWGKTVLAPAMAATHRYDAKLCPGKWCRWCPAITLCPEQSRLPVKVDAAIDFADKPAATLPAPQQLTSEQVSLVLAARERIEGWLSAVDSLARQTIDAGGEIPGWKLVLGRKNRSWTNEAQAEAMLSLAYGEKAYSRKLLSPAGAEKLGFSAPFLVEEKLGNPALVRVEDKRATVARSVISDFSE